MEKREKKAREEKDKKIMTSELSPNDHFKRLTFEDIHTQIEYGYSLFAPLEPVRRNDPEARKADLFGHYVRISPFQVDVMHGNLRRNKITLTIEGLPYEAIDQLSRISELDDIGEILTEHQKGDHTLIITLRKNQSGDVISQARMKNMHQHTSPLNHIFKEPDELQYLWNNLTVPEDTTLEAKPIKGDLKQRQNKDYFNDGAWSPKATRLERRR